MVFEADHNIVALGNTLSARADVEDELGHDDRAITLERDALRLKYLAGDPNAIGVSHHNLANYLVRTGGDRAQVGAHRLAAAILGYQTGSGALHNWLEALGRFLAADAAAVPGSFAQVCALLDQVEGVHLADLVARLPGRAVDGQAALAEVLRLAPQRASARTQQLVAVWEPVLSALVAAHHPDTDPDTQAAAATTLDAALAARGEQDDWGALVGILRRIHAGERNPALSEGLDDIDTAVVERALGVLAGGVQLDLDAWQTLAAPKQPGEMQAPELAALVAAVAAAAEGNADARAQVESVLDQMAASPAWAALAGRLQRILAGDRGPALAENLDEPDTAVLAVVLDHLSSNNPAPSPKLLIARQPPDDPEAR